VDGNTLLKHETQSEINNQNKNERTNEDVQAAGVSLLHTTMK